MDWTDFALVVLFGFGCGLMGFSWARLCPREKEWCSENRTLHEEFVNSVVTALVMSHRTETDKVADQLGKIREAIEHFTETCHLPR